MATKDLIFLYVSVVVNALVMLIFIPGFGYMATVKFLGPFLIYDVLLCFISIGSLIFFAAAISISRNSRSKYLLYAAQGFLILSLLYCVYASYQFHCNGVFDTLMDYEIEMELIASKLPSSEREKLRVELRNGYEFKRKMMYYGAVFYPCGVYHNLMILKSYITKLKRD